MRNGIKGREALGRKIFHEEPPCCPLQWRRAQGTSSADHLPRSPKVTHGDRSRIQIQGKALTSLRSLPSCSLEWQSKPPLLLAPENPSPPLGSHT